MVTGGKTVGMEQVVKRRRGGFDTVVHSASGIKNSVWTFQQPSSNSGSDWAGGTGRDSKLGCGVSSLLCALAGVKEK